MPRAPGNRRPRSRVALLAGLLVLAGCGTSPASRLFVLSAAPPDRPASAWPGAAPVTIGLGAVHVPAMLDRPEIVHRAGPNRVEVAEFDRWAEPTRGMIRRVLQAGLAARLPEPVAVVDAAENARTVGRTVTVDIASFDDEPGGAVTLKADWVIWRGDSDERVRAGRLVQTEPAAGGTEAMVVAMSRALAVLAGQIAAALAEEARQAIP